MLRTESGAIISQGYALSCSLTTGCATLAMLTRSCKGCLGTYSRFHVKQCTGRACHCEVAASKVCMSMCFLTGSHRCISMQSSVEKLRNIDRSAANVRQKGHTSLRKVCVSPIDADPLLGTPA